MLHKKFSLDNLFIWVMALGFHIGFILTWMALVLQFVSFLALILVSAEPLLKIHQMKMFSGTMLLLPTSSFGSPSAPLQPQC